MAIDYVALKSELNTDPFALGYVALKAAGNHVAIAGLLNTARAASVAITLPSISSNQLFGCFTSADYAQVQTNSASDRAWLDKLLAVDVAISTGSAGSQAAAEVIRILGGTNLATCKTRVLAIAQRKPTRAEELNFGIGIVIAPADVAIAYAS